MASDMAGSFGEHRATSQEGIAQRLYFLFLVEQGTRRGSRLQEGLATFRVDAEEALNILSIR